MACGVLSVAHELECFWTTTQGSGRAEGALTELLKVLNTDAQAKPHLNAAAASAVLPAFAKAAADEADGSFVYAVAHRHPKLNSASLCTNLLTNTRACGAVPIKEILDHCRPIFDQEGLSAGDQQGLAKALRTFLEVRLYSHPLKESFLICNSVSNISFLLESAKAAITLIMSGPEIEPLVDAMRELEWPDLNGDLQRAIRAATKDRFRKMCVDNKRCRAIKVAELCLANPSSANLGPELMQTIAASGLSDLETVQSNPLQALTVMSGNTDIISAATEITRIYQTYKAVLTDQDPTAKPSEFDAKAADEAKEALDVELEIGLITKEEHTSKVQSLANASAAEAKGGSAVDLRVRQLNMLLAAAVALMPNRGLVIGLANLMIYKSDIYDGLFDLIAKEGGAYSQAVAAHGGNVGVIWDTLKGHVEEAKTLRRLLDIYVNNFIAGVSDKVTSELVKFPKEAHQALSPSPFTLNFTLSPRQVLAQWDDLVMRDARSHVCIAFVLENQAQLERFSLLLTSTMVFPRVRRDYFKASFPSPSLPPQPEPS